MCYNCGCGAPNDSMGNSKNITEKTFEEAAKVAGTSVQDAKIHTYEQLKQELGG